MQYFCFFSRCNTEHKTGIETKIATKKMDKNISKVRAFITSPLSSKFEEQQVSTALCKEERKEQSRHCVVSFLRANLNA